MTRKLILMAACLSVACVWADENQYQNELVPQVKHAVKFDISLPMHMMTSKPIESKKLKGGSIIDPGPTSINNDQPFVADPMLQDSLGLLPGPVLQSSWDAMDNISGASPP